MISIENGLMGVNVKRVFVPEKGLRAKGHCELCGHMLLTLTCKINGPF